MDRPNVVFVITDNQSPWTLGCYGNDEIRTPNADRLAAEGLRFARSRCVNPVCSPNRATCLTGLIPSRHGVHNWLGQEQPDAQMGPHAYCTVREFPTLPELPGSNYADVLRGKEPGARPETTFHEYENARTVRTPQWKYTRRHPDGPDELLHLAEDPGERINLAERPEYADVRGELNRQLEDFFSRYADPEYDLWKGGRSKAGRVL